MRRIHEERLDAARPVGMVDAAASGSASARRAGGPDDRLSQRDAPPAQALMASVQLVVAIGGLAAGLLAQLCGLSVLAEWLWGGATLAVLMRTALSGARDLLRGKLGVDVIAVLAMIASLWMREALAGNVIAAMLVGGGALERFATSRARKQLDALLAHAPRVVHRLRDGVLSDVDLEEAVPGDVLVVMTGEVVPADGTLLTQLALLDESALTGEFRPVQHLAGTLVASGAINTGSALELQVVRPPGESTFAGIVRLVESAGRQKAPLERMADRYAVGFLVVTLLACLLAWLASGDPMRALAVLVVATPCPLIIAVPVALIAGVSRAARGGVLIRGGGVLEALDRVTVVLFDKTGTVTTSRPEVSRIECCGAASADELLRVAASLEQYSIHPFAPAIVTAAQQRGLARELAQDTHEEPGLGIRGRVGAQQVAVGQCAWVAGSEAVASARAIAARTEVEGSSAVYVAIDGVLQGALVLHNPIRAEAPRVIEDLRRGGVRAVHLVTGDHPDVAELVGDAIGADRVFAERTPVEKVEIVQQLAPQGRTLMVGDGINDAPALATADVGAAMGARGATAASSAADIVLIADRLDGLLLARTVARRSLRLARQSVAVGMGLSVLAMVAAALGALSPIQGAVVQEIIDVTVILNALRALRDGTRTTVPGGAGDALAARLRTAHQHLRPQVEELAGLAARLDVLPPRDALAALGVARERLERELWPHEQDEQQTVYPVVRALMAPADPTGPLIHTHHEIRRLIRLFGRLIDRLPPTGPEAADLRDLRRALYGLHAVLSLHTAQEELAYSMLDAR